MAGVSKTVRQRGAAEAGSSPFKGCSRMVCMHNGIRQRMSELHVRAAGCAARVAKGSCCCCSSYSTAYFGRVCAARRLALASPFHTCGCACIASLVDGSSSSSSGSRVVVETAAAAAAAAAL